MKLGVGLLFVSMTYSIANIANGVFQLAAGDTSGGARAFLGIIGAAAGIVMTGIGITKVTNKP